MADTSLPRPATAEKPCSRCKRVLPLSEFSPDRRTDLGVGSQCKACNRERMKTYGAQNRDKRRVRNRNYRAKNREALAVANRAWREANREHLRAYQHERYVANRDAIRAYVDAWRERNREALKERRRAYYLAHKPEIVAQVREWRRKNPEKLKAQLKKRRALKMGAGEAKLTAAEWRAIMDAYDHRCVYCGRRPRVLSQDHVIPLSKSGPHTAANVVPACIPCNSRKWANELEPILTLEEASRESADRADME